MTRVLPELHKLKEEGKLRAIGLTEGFLSDPAHQMLQTAAHDAHVRRYHGGFNFINPEAAEDGPSRLPVTPAWDHWYVRFPQSHGHCPYGLPLLEAMEEARADSLADLAYRYADSKPASMSSLPEPVMLRT